MNVLEARRRLLDGEIKKRTEEGENISVRSVSRMKPGLTLYGKSEQRTTTGAQLLDFSKASGVDDNAYIQISNIGVSFEYSEQDENSRFITFPCELKAGQSYICTAERSSSDIVLYLPQVKQYLVFGNPFVPEQDVDSITIYVNASAPKGIYKVDYIIINTGSSALPWEPYTGGAPSPSPDYPQEIKSVGDSGEINAYVCGGNLIDYFAAVPNATGAIRYDKERLYYSRDNHTPAIAVQGGATWVLNLKKGEIYINGSSLFPLRIYKGNVFDIGYNSANRIYSNGGNASSYKVQIPQDGTYTIGVWTDAQDIEGYLDWLNVNYIPNQTGISNYEPIQTLPVQTPNGLPGIPVSSGGNYTDANGQQWMCDEIDFKREVYIKRINYFLVKADVTGVSYQDLDGGRIKISLILNGFPVAKSGRAEVLCTRGKSAIIAPENRTGFCFSSGPALYYYNNNSDINSAESFISWVSEHQMSFLYQLSTPVETPLSASELSAYAALRTYSPTTVVSNNAGAWMKLGYKTKKSLEVTD